MNIRKPAFGKRAQEVQSGRRLGIGLQHLLRVWNAGLGGEIELIDNVTAIARQFDTILGFRRSRAWFGKLPSHAAHFDHRHFCAISQNHGHLQHHFERVADVVGGKLFKAFSTIAALQ